MTENAERIAAAQPQAAAQGSATEEPATTPEEDKTVIPVKFNKEMKNLSLDEASCLAQKGMKFDLIAKEYGQLKELAKQEGKSVGAYLLALTERQNTQKKTELLEKCGGDEAFVGHVLALENADTENALGFHELQENFPEFREISDIPEQVAERARLNGTLLLDEYLRYRLNAEQQAHLAKKQQADAGKSSIGSQKDRRDGLNPEAAEFLKGLWK